MLPLKLTVLQVKPDHAQLDVLVNGIHYAKVQTNQPRYLCVDLQQDSLSLQTSLYDGMVEVWQIDKQTLADAASQPQELAIRPNDGLVIRFRLAAVRNRHRPPATYQIQISNQNTFEAHESSIHKDSGTKEQPSQAILIARQKNSMGEPSSTIQPQTLESKPVEVTRGNPELPRLDELAQQRQRIINELFGKLRQAC